MKQEDIVFKGKVNCIEPNPSKLYIFNQEFDCTNIQSLADELKAYHAVGTPEQVTALKAENERLTKQLENAVVLPFLIEVSAKYSVIVFKDKSGKLHKTHTFEKSEAEARLAELEAQNENIKR